jgi:hypothetical protein
MSLHYLRHVFRLHARIPDIVWIDKDDRTFLVATGAGIAEHGGRRYATPVHLLFEGFEKFTTALGAAASFAGSGAHEDLAKFTHIEILCLGRDKSSEGIRLQASGVANRSYSDYAR